MCYNKIGLNESRQTTNKIKRKEAKKKNDRRKNTRLGEML